MPRCASRARSAASFSASSGTDTAPFAPSGGFGVSTSFRATPADGVVWITGASSGIGRATALEFARRGFTVVATARRLAELEALCAEPEAAGRIRAEPGDVTDPAAITRIVEDMAEKHGPLAIAFLNAGTYFPDKGLAFDAELVKRTFDI